MLAAQRLGNQAAVVDDGGVCSQEIEGARGIEEALSIRRSLWTVKGLRSRERRPSWVQEVRGMSGRGGMGA